MRLTLSRIFVCTWDGLGYFWPYLRSQERHYTIRGLSSDPHECKYLRNYCHICAWESIEDNFNWMSTTCTTTIRRCVINQFVRAIYSNLLYIHTISYHKREVYSCCHSMPECMQWILQMSHIRLSFFILWCQWTSTLAGSQGHAFKLSSAIWKL